MTALIGRRGDPVPTTCCVCGRLAHGLGVAPQFGKSIAWLCTSPDCIAIGQRIYVMHAKELNNIEAKAISAAGSAAMSAIVKSVLGAVWETGVRSLDALDAVAFEAVRGKLAADPDYMRAIESVLRDYGANVKRLVDSNEAPF